MARAVAPTLFLLVGALLFSFEGVLADRDDRRTTRQTNAKKKSGGLSQVVVKPDGQTEDAGEDKNKEAKPDAKPDAKPESKPEAKPSDPNVPTTEVQEASTSSALDLARENQAKMVKKSVNAEIAKHFGSNGGEQSFTELEPLLKKVGYPDVSAEEFMGTAKKLGQKKVELKLNRFIDGLHDYPMTHLSLPEAFQQFLTGSSDELVSVSALQKSLENLNVDPDEIEELITAAKNSGPGAKGDVFKYKEFITKYDKNGLAREGNPDKNDKAAL